MLLKAPETGAPPRRRLFRAAALLASTVVALIAGELGMRVYLLAHPARLRTDEKLGWRCVEGYSSTGDEVDMGGVHHRITYSTNRDGFREFGDLGAARPRILVLGDSYTQAVAVSDGETYHHLVGRALGAEVFAYGAGGYGSLQEWMVLDEWLDRIHPDLVLWQFCTNDFINNDEALEYGSRWDNNGMRRPYLQDDGTVAYALPKPLPWFRRLGETSKLEYALLLAWDRIGARLGDTVETEIEREGERHAGFRHSVAVTEKTLELVRKRCGATPLYAFSADGREPYDGAFREICARTGVERIHGVAEAVRAASARGVCIRAGDRVHWNEEGHRIAAEVIAQALGRSALFSRRLGAR